MSREEELKKEGWIKQFVASEPRLSECVELYKSLGYEVHLEIPTDDELTRCGSTCYDAERNKYRVIYIRRKGHRSQDYDELF